MGSNPTRATKITKRNQMKTLLLTILLLAGGTSFAEKKFNYDFSEHLYKENSWNIFLFMCEKTADCLDIDAGWSKGNAEKGESHRCYLHFIKDKRSLVVKEIEDLLSVYAACRAKNDNIINQFNRLENR